MEDFNHIKDWLLPILKEQNLSIQWLSKNASLSRAAIYNYLKDVNRPDEAAMTAICTALEVPTEEGFRQYTPRKRGRPAKNTNSIEQLAQNL